MTDRRSFVAWLGSLPLLRRRRSLSRAPILIEATPTALYQQPDGRNNLVRVAVTGLEPHGGRAHRAPRRMPRTASPKPGCGAGPNSSASRLPVDRRVRTPADLVCREPAPRRGGIARARPPRRQGRLFRPVRATTDGDPRP